jgi:thymidylate kinase
MPEQINSSLGQVDVTQRDKAPTKDSAQGYSLSHFLRLLFRLCDENGIRYCVLHSWRGLPDELPSDLDLAVHPRDRAKLPSVFQGLLNEGYRPVQHRHHEGGHRFDFVWFEPQGMSSAGIDVADEYREHGMILWRGEELVRRRWRFNGFWVADPAIEFAYTLAKKALKGTLPQHQTERLKVLVNELGKPQAQRIAAELFGARWKERVVEACANGSLSNLLGELKKKLWLRKLRSDPLNPVRKVLGDVPRLIGRWFKPTGIFLVILGPDGVGKSTLVGRLAESLDQAAFNGFHIYHWRPMVIAPQKETGVPSTDPHDEPPRGTLGSIVTLFGVLLDYWLGFAFVLRPFLARSGLIVFDRYYHDLLIDPIRYRYGGPMWLAEFLGRFIPPPDLLFLVLDAGDEVILSRKREVPSAELRRQREGYQQFTLGTKRATLINTDQGVEPTAGEATRFIVGFLTQRFQRRDARWLAPAR